MSEIRYDRLVEGALRGVIKDALKQVEATGLPGDHHFYITFDVDAQGVEIPPYLKAQYQNEMTIVLQHQFYGLTIDDTSFSVTLSFSGKAERLVIPYAAISTFADPSVNFALQFQIVGEPSDDDDDSGSSKPKEDKAEAKDAEPKGQVISLDSFRKKP